METKFKILKSIHSPTPVSQLQRFIINNNNNEKYYIISTVYPRFIILINFYY